MFPNLSILPCKPGSIKTVVSGVPRFSELLNATKNPKLVSCNIYFKEKNNTIKELRKMDDDLAIEYITQLKGLGVWSAQMFLMFNLNRPDIFPIKDIGLIRAISKNYNISYPPSQRFLNKISKLHLGYRSVFTWYMWRSIDPVDVEY